MTRRFDPDFEDYEGDYNRREESAWERESYKDYPGLEDDQDVDFDSFIDDMD